MLDDVFTFLVRVLSGVLIDDASLCVLPSLRYPVMSTTIACSSCAPLPWRCEGQGIGCVQEVLVEVSWVFLTTRYGVRLFRIKASWPMPRALFFNTIRVSSTAAQ